MTENFLKLQQTKASMLSVMNMKKSFTFLAAALAFFATVQAQTVVEFDILNPTSFEPRRLHTSPG